MVGNLTQHDIQCFPKVLFCKAYVHQGYCVRPKRSPDAMQMQLLVFLWLCKKNLYVHLILYKYKSIEYCS